MLEDRRMLPPSPDYSTHSVAEAMGRLRIHDNYEENDGPFPNRPSEPDCVHYLRTGSCRFGSKCRFNHPLYTQQAQERKTEYPERPGEPECSFYMKTGACKYGSLCKYHHPLQRSATPILLNVLGLPMRQDEKSCPFYMQTGSCKFGAACKFHHPQPSSAGYVLPVQGPSVSDSLVMPTSGVTYVGRMPALALPNSSYVSSSGFQVSQAYMPVLVSPTQGWTTYMASFSPGSVPSIGGDLGSKGQVSASLGHLPERPDQPECRYFLRTGSCKYGPDCKYHHPRHETALSAPNSLSPIGLPLRPGQALCSYYSLYGLCRYGPACKFDHPFSGYPFAA